MFHAHLIYIDVFGDRISLNGRDFSKSYVNASDSAQTRGSLSMSRDLADRLGALTVSQFGVLSSTYVTTIGGWRAAVSDLSAPTGGGGSGVPRHGLRTARRELARAGIRYAIGAVGDERSAGRDAVTVAISVICALLGLFVADIFMPIALVVALAPSLLDVLDLLSLFKHDKDTYLFVSFGEGPANIVPTYKPDVGGER